MVVLVHVLKKSVAHDARFIITVSDVAVGLADCSRVSESVEEGNKCAQFESHSFDLFLTIITAFKNNYYIPLVQLLTNQI